MQDALIRELRRRGLATAPELQRALGISQPTLWRALAKARAQVITVGRAKATRYTLRRDLRGLGTEFPLYQVGTTGQLLEAGALACLEGGRWYGYDPVTGTQRLFDGLPYFLSDLRPQGFMGRAFPKQHPDLQLPDRITDWSDDDAMIAIARRGHDLIGNLIVGAQSMQAYLAALARPVPNIRESERLVSYPQLAEAALQGDPAGSSAGGEQPKFAVAITNGTALRHVLVKFSPPDDTQVSQRWRDLLVAEHLASLALAEAPAAVRRALRSAETRLLEAGGRLFLEVTRFDRVGEHGRRGVISLGAFDDEHYGRRDNWVLAAERLERDRVLASQDAEALRLAYAFGGLIANTDRHFGNVSLLVDPGAPRLYLAPIYDQLPMFYAPSSGQLIDRQFTVELPEPTAIAAWKQALPLAESFWERVARDDRVSASFRQNARDNAAQLRDQARPIAQTIVFPPPTTIAAQSPVAAPPQGRRRPGRLGIGLVRRRAP